MVASSILERFTYLFLRNELSVVPSWNKVGSQGVKEPCSEEEKGKCDSSFWMELVSWWEAAPLLVVAWPHGAVMTSIGEMKSCIQTVMSHPAAAMMGWK